MLPSLPGAALVLAAAAFAAPLQLGLQSSRPAGLGPHPSPMRIATDNAGAVYFLAGVSQPPAGAVLLGQGPVFYSCITKLSPGGGSTVWTACLDVLVFDMAVDPGGNPSVVSWDYASGVALFTRLSPDAHAIAARLPLGQGIVPVALASAPDGRIWLAGQTMANYSPSVKTTADAVQSAIPNMVYSHPFVVRVNAAGTAIDYATYLTGSLGAIVTGIAVDATGSLAAGGVTSSPDFPFTTAPSQVQNVQFLARLRPGSSRPLYAVASAGDGSVSGPLAIDPAGNVVVASAAFSPFRLLLRRFDSQGVLLASTPLAATSVLAVGMDSAGNSFVLGQGAANFPLQHNLAPCGSANLSVFDPNGALLQSTWLPGSPIGIVRMATQPDGAVYAVTADGLLMHLSPAATSPAVSLGCAGDAATYNTGAIAPGEWLEIFGEGFAAQPQVTFDGRPATLLNVTEKQILAAAPWSLEAGSNTAICVADTCVTRAVVQAAPVVFPSPDGYAYAINPDGTANSPANPAPTGSFVWIFGTGFGPVLPPPSEGADLPWLWRVNLLPVTASRTFATPISGVSVIPLEVTYAGPLPLANPGLTLIRLEAASGSIDLHVGTTGVRVAIHVQ